MFKKIIPFILAVALLFTACNNQTAESSGVASEEMPSSSETTQTPVDSNAIPAAKPLTDYLYKMQLEPTTHSLPADAFRVPMISGYDAHWEFDDEWTSQYSIEKVKIVGDETLSGEGDFYGYMTLTTTPPDLKGHFGVETDEEVANELKAVIFTAENVHDGLLTGARDDFGYEILTDVQGTIAGYNAFYMEFIKQDEGIHSIRLYLSNDEMNENHVALALNADVPVDQPEVIEEMRSMLLAVEKVVL